MPLYAGRATTANPFAPTGSRSAPGPAGSHPSRPATSYARGVTRPLPAPAPDPPVLRPGTVGDSGAGDDSDLALPPLRLGPLAAGWTLFWLLMLTVAVQEFQRSGDTGWWKPLLWEGSSCLVASALLAWQWRRLPRLDASIGQPRRWFLRALLELPLWAVGFVLVVFSLRHGVYALLGERYEHAPWPQVLRYESLKFALFYALFTVVLFGLRSHAALGAARLRAERAQALTQRAQLLQLTQQLEPHFLFNALNTIAATVHSDAALADRLLTQLASLLRAATDVARRPLQTLNEELHLLQAYAAIMAERFADRVQLEWDIDDAARDCSLPSLALQPLLENCFRHGVERSAREARIRVQARCRDQRLCVTVEDDVGLLPASWQPGVGLGNLRQRLAAAYGGAALLALSAREGGGVVATLELPCRP